MRTAVVLGLVVMSGWADAQPGRRRRDNRIATQTSGVGVGVGVGAGVALARATVEVLDGAEVRARGVVLARTGWVMTALWRVEGVREPRVRYPDGRVDRARVVAVDRAWGVALLEGAAGRWPEGIELATRGVRSREAVSWVTARGAVSTGMLQRRVSLVGGGAVLLRDAWELDPVPARTATGSGVVSQSDGVLVALVVSPEREATATGPEHAYGVPAEVLSGVIEGVGQGARPWLGVTFEEVPPGSNVMAAEGGLRVAAVDPQGPGAIARLRVGERADVVLAVDGRPVRSLAELAAVLEGRRPGEPIVLWVLRDGAMDDVGLMLGVRPGR